MDNKINILVVGGYSCSGKSTLAQSLTQQESGVRVLEVSTIVRSLVQSMERSEMQDSTHLETTIGMRLISLIRAESRKDDVKHIVIVGPRQLSICYAIEKLVRSDDHYGGLRYLWLDTCFETRLARFKKQSDKSDPDKSLFTYLDILHRDQLLGVERVRRHMQRHMYSVKHTKDSNNEED